MQTSPVLMDIGTQMSGHSETGSRDRRHYPSASVAVDTREQVPARSDRWGDVAMDSVLDAATAGHATAAASKAMGVQYASPDRDASVQYSTPDDSQLSGDSWIHAVEVSKPRYEGPLRSSRRPPQRDEFQVQRQAAESVSAARESDELERRIAEWIQNEVLLRMLVRPPSIAPTEPSVMDIRPPEQPPQQQPQPPPPAQALQDTQNRPQIPDDAIQEWLDDHLPTLLASDVRLVAHQTMFEAREAEARAKEADAAARRLQMEADEQARRAQEEAEIRRLRDEARAERQTLIDEIRALRREADSATRDSADRARQQILDDAQRAKARAEAEAAEKDKEEKEEKERARVAMREREEMERRVREAAERDAQVREAARLAADEALRRARKMQDAHQQQQLQQQQQQVVVDSDGTRQPQTQSDDLRERLARLEATVAQQRLPATAAAIVGTLPTTGSPSDQSYSRSELLEPTISTDSSTSAVYPPMQPQDISESEVVDIAHQSAPLDLVSAETSSFGVSTLSTHISDGEVLTHLYSEGEMVGRLTSGAIQAMVHGRLPPVVLEPGFVLSTAAATGVSRQTATRATAPAAPAAADGASGDKSHTSGSDPTTSSGQVSSPGQVSMAEIAQDDTSAFIRGADSDAGRRMLLDVSVSHARMDATAGPALPSIALQSIAASASVHVAAQASVQPSLPRQRSASSVRSAASVETGVEPPDPATDEEYDEVARADDIPVSDSSRQESQALRPGHDADRTIRQGADMDATIEDIQTTIGSLRVSHHAGQPGEHQQSPASPAQHRSSRSASRSSSVASESPTHPLLDRPPAQSLLPLPSRIIQMRQSSSSSSSSSSLLSASVSALSPNASASESLSVPLSADSAGSASIAPLSSSSRASVLPDPYEVIQRGDVRSSMQSSVRDLSDDYRPGAAAATAVAAAASSRTSPTFSDMGIDETRHTDGDDDDDDDDDDDSTEAGLRDLHARLSVASQRAGLHASPPHVGSGVGGGGAAGEDLSAMFERISAIGIRVMNDARAHADAEPAMDFFE
ncbi:hypothetical protein BC831DRAFT_297122 [Entophlyctis helioformis]|nr:hypothetical protein BC831DRAFT_297122 [Entophlyctis helioformis]